MTNTEWSNTCSSCEAKQVEEVGGSKQWLAQRLPSEVGR